MVTIGSVMNPWVLLHLIVWVVSPTYWTICQNLALPISLSVLNSAISSWWSHSVDGILSVDGLGLHGRMNNLGHDWLGRWVIVRLRGRQILARLGRRNPKRMHAVIMHSSIIGGIEGISSFGFIHTEYILFKNLKHSQIKVANSNQTTYKSQHCFFHIPEPRVD